MRRIIEMLKLINLLNVDLVMLATLARIPLSLGVLAPLELQLFHPVQHDLWIILGVGGVVVCMALGPVIAACIRHNGAIAAVRCSSDRFAVGGAGLA